MFDRRHAMVARTEHRRTARIDDVIGMRRKFDGIVETKTQTAVDSCRRDANARGFAGMQTDARKFDRAAERCLMLQNSVLVGMAGALGFERFDACVEFRKAPDVRLYPHVLAMLARGRAADGRARRDVAPDLANRRRFSLANQR